MNKLMPFVLTAGITFAAQVFAENAPTDSASNNQVMKECMSRMAAKNDGSSTDTMKKACKAEMNDSMNKDSMPKDSASDHDSAARDTINTPPPR